MNALNLIEMSELVNTSKDEAQLGTAQRLKQAILTRSLALLQTI